MSDAFKHCAQCKRVSQQHQVSVEFFYGHARAGEKEWYCKQKCFDEKNKVKE